MPDKELNYLTFEFLLKANELNFLVKLQSCVSSISPDPTENRKESPNKKQLITVFFFYQNFKFSMKDKHERMDLSTINLKC